MIAKIDVEERGDKESLNTPGGEELMKSMGAAGDGLPFFAFVDSAGNVIVNSIRPAVNGKKGENIGHPDKPEEVDWFLTMLHRAIPRMLAEESATLEHSLRNQKK